MISSAVTHSTVLRKWVVAELTWAQMSKSCSKFSHVYECLKAFCSYLRLFLTALKGGNLSCKTSVFLSGYSLGPVTGHHKKEIPVLFPSQGSCIL